MVDKYNHHSYCNLYPLPTDGKNVLCVVELLSNVCGGAENVAGGEVLHTGHPYPHTCHTLTRLSQGL